MMSDIAYEKEQQEELERISYLEWANSKDFDRDEYEVELDRSSERDSSHYQSSQERAYAN